MKLKKADIAAFVIFIVAPLFLFREGLRAGMVLFGYDIVTLDLPLRMFAQDSLKLHSQLPLWLPGILMGMPLIDSSNLILFYPINLLMMLLGVPVSATYLPDIIFHLLLGALGVFLFLRSIDLRKEEAWFGAFVYMTCGTSVSLVAAGHMGNIIAVALLPWAFYFVEKAVKKSSLLWWLSLGAIFGLQVLGIGMQIMIYTAAGVCVYIIYRTLTSGGTLKMLGASIFLFLMSGIYALVISAPQFFPSLDYLKHSWRQGLDYNNFISFSLHPAETLSFFLPRFFGIPDKTYWGWMQIHMVTFYAGLLPFVLAPFAFSKEKKKTAIFFAGMTGFLLFLAYGGYTPVYKLFYALPVFNNFRNPTRFLYVASFFMAVLCATGLSNIINENEKNNEPAMKKIFNVLALVVIPVALGLCGLQFSGFFKETVPALFTLLWKTVMPVADLPVVLDLIKSDIIAFTVISGLGLLLVYLTINRHLKNAAVIAMTLMAIHFVDISKIEKTYINFKPLKSVISENPVADFFKKDKTLYRAVELDKKTLPNKNFFYGIEFQNGYHGMVQGKLYEMLRCGAFRSININRAFNVKYYINDVAMTGPGFKKVFDGELKIFEDEKVMPRFFVAGKTIKVESPQEALTLILSKEFRPDVPVVEGWAPADSSIGKTTPVEVLSYTANEVQLKVNTTKAGLLVVAGYYYPRWKAVVNGIKTEVFPVNYLAYGVPVQKGENKVRLYYDGFYIIMYLVAALFAFLLLLLVAVDFYRNRQKS